MPTSKCLNGCQYVTHGSRRIIGGETKLQSECEWTRRGIVGLKERISGLISPLYDDPQIGHELDRLSKT